MSDLLDDDDEQPRRRRSYSDDGAPQKAWRTEVIDGEPVEYQMEGKHKVYRTQEMRDWALDAPQRRLGLLVAGTTTLSFLAAHAQRIAAEWHEFRRGTDEPATLEALRSWLVGAWGALPDAGVRIVWREARAMLDGAGAPSRAGSDEQRFGIVALGRLARATQECGGKPKPGEPSLDFLDRVLVKAGIRKGER